MGRIVIMAKLSERIDLPLYYFADMVVVWNTFECRDKKESEV